MNVQDLKRWHWLALSIVVGLALSYVWSSVEWDQNLPTIGQRDFEAGLVIPFPTQGHLDNVTVMPPVDGRHKVVAEQLRNTKTPGVVEFRPVAFMAQAPYVAGQWRGGDEEHPDVVEYLKKAQAASPEVRFNYAWYRETWAIYALWTSAAVLLIGGVWPSVVSLMVGAGLGLKREEKGPEYDLSRFKSEAPKETGHRVPTAEEIAHMRQLEEELERKLEAQRLGMPIPEDAPQPATSSAPRKLDGGPLETVAADKPQDEHEYKGEFYPVDRHVVKKK
jgi:hypothetical protein